MKINSFTLALVLILWYSSIQAQDGLIGPGKGSVINNQIIGQFLNWDRKATPSIVLRVHGAGILQTFADISDL